MANSISLEMVWIPKSENDKADYLSNLTDFDDLVFPYDNLQIIENKCGKLEVRLVRILLQCKIVKVLFKFLEPFLQWYRCICRIFG